MRVIFFIAGTIVKKYFFGSKCLLKFPDNQQNYLIALYLYTNICVNNKTQQKELGYYLLAQYFISRPLSLISRLTTGGSIWF